MLFPFVLGFGLVGCDEVVISIDDTGTSAGNPDDTGNETVVSGAIEVSPPTITLPTIFVGGRTSSSITISNVGSGPMSASVLVVGGWSTSYTLDSYVASLPSGASSTHTLSLSPTDWGDHSVSVLVDDPDSGGHVEVMVSAWVQLDEDGDLHGSITSGGDDCNDANAAVNPSAADVWYDGVDSDCAGNDDYDQDGDGQVSSLFGGEDCVDVNPAIYAGAFDAWYDGVDSDCAGNDDYDQDGDGYVSVEYQGLATENVPGSGNLPLSDCDDANPLVNSARTDTWYDGTDSDCGGNSDFDQDADGFDSWEYGGTDCVDTDPAVYAGAADVWYDAIDSDCAGDNDFDQDLDGVEYPTDCNDTDATVTGPVSETANGIDDDCNGLIDDFSVEDIASGYLYGAAASAAIGDHGLLAMGADVTGDGLTDLILGAPSGASGYGALYVVDGLVATSAAGAVTSYDTAALTGDSGYYAIGHVNGPMADVDNDGTSDLAFGGSYGYYGYGRSYLFSGGSALTGSLSSSAYTARISGDGSSYYGSTDYSRMIALSDLDGDGFAELVVGSGYDDYGSDTDSGSVAIFSGDGLSETALEIDDADDRIYGADDYDYAGWQLVAADVNGDGKGDFLVSAIGNDDAASNAGVVYLVRGGATLTYDTRIDDAAELEVRGNVASLALGEDTLAHPGDVDADGFTDVGFTSESSGAAWLFLNLGSSSGTLSLSSADYTFAGTAGDLGSSLVMDSDLDGDGADEFVLGADGDDAAGSNAGTVFVFRWDSGWSSALTSANASASIYGSAAEAYFGAGGAGGADLDADGFDDIVVGEPRNDTAASDAGAVWIIRGG